MGIFHSRGGHFAAALESLLSIVSTNGRIEGHFIHYVQYIHVANFSHLKLFDFTKVVTFLYQFGLCMQPSAIVISAFLKHQKLSYGS